MTKIITWNVNGIRANARNGFLEWLQQEKPHVLCLQETKASPADLDEALLQPPGYTTTWTPAVKKGYSGVAAFWRKGYKPLQIEPLGDAEFDDEGRVQLLHYDAYTIINAYFPNSQAEGARLPYKLRFCQAVMAYCEKLRRGGRHVIVCGDYNIAHKEIDLARPKQNVKSPGFLPEERAFMDDFTAAGYIDTFRHFCEDPGHYTWWSYRARAREKNVGWRIDYHCVNEEFLPAVKECRILSDVMGSDHCPVLLTLKRKAPK